MESSLCCLDFSVSSKLLKATLNSEIDCIFSLWVMTATKDWKQSGKPLTIMAMTKLSDTVSPAFLRAAVAVKGFMNFISEVSQERLTGPKLDHDVIFSD